MNDEALRFIKGTTQPAGDMFETEIHVQGEILWLARVVIYGASVEDTEGLRDRLFNVLTQPEKPEFFQWESKVCPGSWTNCMHAGEAVNLKADGFNIRGCYLRAK